MYEAFIEFLDSLFWEGYAENLAKENPQQFNDELNQFFEQHQWKQQ